MKFEAKLYPNYKKSRKENNEVGGSFYMLIKYNKTIYIH